MHTEKRRRLEELMEGAAGGDRAAGVALAMEFTRELRAALRSVAAQEGLRIDEAQLGGLVIDAGLELARLARGWRPSGALPWRWARHRLANLARREAAMRCVPFDEASSMHRAALEHGLRRECTEDSCSHPADDDRSNVQVLAALAARDPGVALVRSALDAVGGDDKELFLQYVVLKNQGDPSPAETVGRDFGLQPAAVRKRVSRARKRLRAFARAHPGYESLLALPLLCGPAGMEARVA